MQETKTAIANKVVWVDLASSDASASRQFYSKLFGWNVEVSPDPQHGGYAMAKLGGKDVAGIGPKMMAEAPTAWSVYIGTEDADALAKKVQAAGGKVISAPFEVGDQGKMAVFQDPIGAFISAWQPTQMRGFQTNAPNTYGWVELNARGIDKAVDFYKKVFGWSPKRSDMGEGQQYTEFQVDGQSIAGGMEISPGLPASVPSYWTVYFNVDDVDRAFALARSAGATEMVAPQDFPGGRFAILQDPQGAAFGLLKMKTP